LPGGLVGLPYRWAATSNVNVGQTIYPVNKGRVGIEVRKGTKSLRGGDGRRQWNRERVKGT